MVGRVTLVWIVKSNQRRALEKVKVVSIGHKMVEVGEGVEVVVGVVVGTREKEMVAGVVVGTEEEETVAGVVIGTREEEAVARVVIGMKEEGVVVGMKEEQVVVGSVIV